MLPYVKSTEIDDKLDVQILYISAYVTVTVTITVTITVFVSVNAKTPVCRTFRDTLTINTHINH